MLQAAQRAGNLPWAMQEMADSGRRRFLYRLQAIVQAVFPAAVICFGLMVMFIVVSLFLPLVSFNREASIMKTVRRGMTLLELVVAGALLGTMLVVCLQLLAATAAQRRTADQRQLALLKSKTRWSGWPPGLGTN